ncbi:hypothetical protein [Actinomadura rubrisoli]|uniref:Uncharacterized protein n=1 Tax=Actinomadura rubrisoli TaxID=2530368 RepID=A0A4R5CGL8_9ACTN|nr:hypothetical protein [Actinomadura rubrisoli]TDD98176.1 hypothetical protein E1298_00495 [Actinomadura rubrisoli]
MNNLAPQAPAVLKPLDPALSPQVRTWASELRTIWAASGMSINRFAHLHPVDKGTLSRYLNGRRVPRDHWFLDKLLAVQAEQGKEVSQEVREHLTRLQLEALQVAHPQEYRVRLVSDELELAVVGQREAERYARSLEEQLADRNHRLEELTDQHGRLRAAWDADRAATQAHKNRLDTEIADLTRHLDQARQRSTHAEQRCRNLEDLLDRLDTPPASAPDFIQGIPLTGPDVVAQALEFLWNIGAGTQVAALAERAAAEFPLTDPVAVARVLDSLIGVGAGAQVVVLAERTAEVPLTDPAAVLQLLPSLRDAGACTEAAALAERTAAEVPLTDPAALVRLLKFLLGFGTGVHGRVLAERVETSFPLADPADVAGLLVSLQDTGADANVVALAERAATDAPLTDPYNVAKLLKSLRAIGAGAQAAVLAERVATDAPLTNHYGVGRMLESLRVVGAGAQATALTERVATEFPLRDPAAVGRTLDLLLGFSCDAQAMALAKRAAAGAPLSDPAAVAQLLDSLRAMGADTEVRLLNEREGQFRRSQGHTRARARP